MTNQTQQLFQKLPNQFKKVQNQPFSFNAKPFQQLTPVQQVVIKLYLMTVHNQDYETYRDLFTAPQILKQLQNDHPNTDLNDLKSLTSTYQLLQQYPHGLFLRQTPKFSKIQVLTYGQVAQNLIKRWHEFKADDSYSHDKLLQSSEYLLKQSGDIKPDEDFYQDLSTSLTQSPYTDVFYKKFNGYSDVLDAWQIEIHDIATSCDYDDSDPDDFADYGMQFDGYSDDIIDELQTTLNRYQKFAHQKHHAGIYDTELKPVQLRQLIDWIDQFPLNQGDD